LREVFQTTRESGKAAFVGYLTAGYPKMEDTVDLLLALEQGGADVIELGVPFTDPQADGATIQHTNEIALANKVTPDLCLDMVKKAREQGLTAPVILMGYYNPFLAHGLDKLMEDCKEAGVDGFIVVDLPPEEGGLFVNTCREHDLSFVPLVSPTTTDDRISFLSDAADSFLYCVSLTGVTGSRTELPADLSDFLARIRKQTDLPLAVGFGISKPDHVKTVSANADGIVVGSAIMNTIDTVDADAPTADKCAAVKVFVESMKEARVPSENFQAGGEKKGAFQSPETSGSHFGEFGGRYIPETLIEAHRELEEEYEKAKVDPEFIKEIDFYRRQFIGGPTPLYFAERLTKAVGGAQIWLKREELAHTGAHKINNAVGQAILAKRIGKDRIIAETGAGQHGVATATVCAHFGLKCIVYMGAVDCERQALNVFRMKMLGADVRPVFAGQKTLKDAINEAMRDWVTNVRDTHYLIGSAIGPHPFPLIVRDFQSIIGKEARQQMLDQVGRLPDVVVACVGGGSNAIGMFHPFVEDKEVRLVGVEAGGEGLDNKHSATLSKGTPGVLHGTRTYLIQDEEGQIPETHSISAGLDYPGVGPEHSFLKDMGRAEYVSVTDAQVLEGFQTLSRSEGIIPALEPSHAVYHAMQLAKEMSPDQIVLVNLCGRGDKDMHTVAKAYGVDLSDYTTIKDDLDVRNYGMDT